MHKNLFISVSQKYWEATWLTWYKISIGELLFLKNLNTTADNCPRNRTRTIAQHTQYRTGRVTNAKKTKNATHSSLVPEAEMSRKSKSWTQTSRKNGKTNTNSDTIWDVFVWISLAQYKLRTAMLTNKNMHVVNMAGTFSSLKWKILSAKTIPPNTADDRGKCFDMDNIFSFLNTLYFCSMLSDWYRFQGNLAWRIFQSSSGSMFRWSADVSQKHNLTYGKQYVQDVD